jgi:hypothetical protein
MGSVWALLAAIIGSCGALLISIVSVWNSRRQLRIQLERQAYEFKLSREMSLRRDVYLEAAEAIARATNSLNELADVGASGAELARRFTADFATIAKVHVIGSLETIDALMRVTQELSNSQSVLNSARLPLMSLQRELDATPEPNAARRREFTEARLALAEQALDCAQRVVAHVPEAIAAIRRELELPQRENYQQAFESAWGNMHSHLRQHTRELREELQGQRQKEAPHVRSA